ncbi:MAG: hypothetical protein Q8J97_11835 [Flavobacteriaceae bacterium]|nr:hypothetical protein [Flavobacteriaceae bacterium]
MSLGEVGYKKYKESVGGIAWNGNKMKEYDELPQNIKTAWEDSANAIRSTLDEVFKLKKTMNEYLDYVLRDKHAELKNLDELISAKKEVFDNLNEDEGWKKIKEYTLEKIEEEEERRRCHDGH